MSDLASALRITKASLYYHIASKESLLFVLPVRALDLIVERTTAAAARTMGGSYEVLRAVVRAQVLSALGAAFSSGHHTGPETSANSSPCSALRRNGSLEPQQQSPTNASHKRWTDGPIRRPNPDDFKRMNTESAGHGGRVCRGRRNLAEDDLRSTFAEHDRGRKRSRAGNTGNN